MSKLPLPSEYGGRKAVTAAEMAAVDAKAIASGIPALTLMENAGRVVAEAAVRFLQAKGIDPARAKVTACCGRGNNGGDGLVAARHLKTMGADVEAFVAAPRRNTLYTAEFSENLRRAPGAGVAVREPGEDAASLEERLKSSDLAIDALLGTGSAGKPVGRIADMIRAMTRSKVPVIAVDIPSGIHPDTGYHSGVFVTAAVTVALALPKRGLLAPHALKYVGELVVADIGIPEGLTK